MKFDDGHEEDHPIIKAKSPDDTKNLVAVDPVALIVIARKRYRRNNDDSGARRRGTEGNGERKGNAMKRLKNAVSLIVMAIGLSVGASAFAADAPAVSTKDDLVKEALAKDAVCTKCHDENDNKPILAYYQTRHGVKADPRTPGCQTCHGASDAHVKNPQGISPRPAARHGVRHHALSASPPSTTRPAPASPVTSRATARTGPAASINIATSCAAIAMSYTRQPTRC